jgi:hypothetical protein
VCGKQLTLRKIKFSIALCKVGFITKIQVFWNVTLCQRVADLAGNVKGTKNLRHVGNCLRYDMS